MVAVRPMGPRPTSYDQNSLNPQAQQDVRRAQQQSPSSDVALGFDLCFLEKRERVPERKVPPMISPVRSMRNYCNESKEVCIRRRA